MIWIQNVSMACDLAAPTCDMTGLVWCIRARDCGLWERDFWESRLETWGEHAKC